MPPRNDPDRIRIAFDDTRVVANARLLLPATLALHRGLSQLVQERLDLGDAPGRANTGHKIMTLVASALAGGDCIGDADALRTGRTACALGCVGKAPSTLRTFLRSFTWGYVRQLGGVSRQLLARAWQAGAGPGDAPFTIDLDSTICETYGLAKEGARHHGYTGARGYHPLLAIAAGAGDVPMARLREGRANTARGASPPTAPAQRSGRADGGHQDPQPVILLSPRTAQPLGAPPHPASPPALALGNPVQSRPGPAASHSIPGLTAPSAIDPPTGQPKVSADSRQPGPRLSPLACCPANPTRCRHCGPPLAPRTTIASHHRPHLLGSNPDRRIPMPLTLCSNA